MTVTINPAARAALFDIDGTLTDASQGNAWDALIHAPETSALKRSWLYATALPHHLLSKTGIVSQAGFRDRWARLMAWLMAGWSAADVQAVCERIVTQCLIPVVRSDVVALLKQHIDAGQPVVLVSTMFEPIVQGFAAHVGATTGVGSVLGFQDGMCTGKIVGETCTGERKVTFAQRYLAQHHPALDLAECAAYADSASDVPFLAGIGLPTAIYPDDTMRAEAAARGWPIYAGE